MLKGFYKDASKITGKKPSQCKSKLQKELRKRAQALMKSKKGVHKAKLTSFRDKKIAGPRLKSTRSRLLQKTPSDFLSHFAHQLSQKNNLDEDTTHADQFTQVECNNSQNLFPPGLDALNWRDGENTIVFDPSDPFLGFAKNGAFEVNVGQPFRTTALKFDDSSIRVDFRSGNIEQKVSINEQVSAFYVPRESNQFDWADSNEGDLNFNRIPDLDNKCDDSECPDNQDEDSRLSSDQLFRDSGLM